MDELFGLPMQYLLIGCLALFALADGLLLTLAVRNRLLVKLGLRKFARRPGRAALIITGLMLGTTIITAAFSTGDTMTHTVRALTVQTLGNVDEVVSLRGAGEPWTPGQPASNRANYFDQALFDKVREAAASVSEVDGVAPVVNDAVAVQDLTTRQNEPAMVLFATDPAHMQGFGSMKVKQGPNDPYPSLAANEAILNEHAADELDAKLGDDLMVFAAGQAVQFKVGAVVKYDGAGTTESAMIMRLDAAQALVARPGQINRIIVSNRGGATDGADRTDAVMAALQPKLAALGLEADPTKRDQLKLADDAGSVFTSAFVTFGSFSVVAGVMLIFLIFVMLAAERKSEMGIARAIGMQRSQLVQMFAFEGMAYDLIAAVIGAGLGVLVAAGMVLVMASALGSQGLEIEHDVKLRSLVVAYTIGVVLTFLVVTFSAWKVSVLNIVAAVRNLPEREAKVSKRRGWRWGAIMAVFGVFLAYVGLSAKQATPYYMGTGLVMMSFIPLLRRAGASDRLAYTVAGGLLTVLMLAPSSATNWFLPQFSSDFSMFVTGGTLAVLGASWLVMYNSDLVLAALIAVFGRFRLMAPVIKTSVARALNNRMRTGMAVAMFSLVVLTLVVMATVTGGVMSMLGKEEAFDGGYDVSATTLRINPVSDMAAAIEASPDLDPADFTGLSAQSLLSVQVRQTGASNASYHDYYVRGLDSGFMRDNTFEFAMIAEGYDSPRAVWDAVEANPGLAVLDAYPVPSRINYNISAGGSDFRIEGIYREDTSLKPFQVDVLDPATGASRTLTVIGVLQESFSPLISYSINTSQQTMVDVFGPEQAAPVMHLFRLRKGADAEDVANRLESAFLMNGMNAQTLREQQQDLIAGNVTFNYLLQGFMGLGLIVGVAALGVISARSVVERRQQIGVLRALGFQKGMVELSFLLESSFIAVLGIVVGTVLGLVISFNVVTDYSNSGGHGELPFIVPWLNLAVIFGAAYAVSLATTFLPARQAARVYPAEALRYE
jgi:putative ABC transport system permease protein